MTEQEILNIYKKMGLGTQEERDRLSRWFPIESQQKNPAFISESPNTKIEKNAELEPDFKRDHSGW